MLLAGSFGGRVRLTVDLAAPAGDGVSLSASITDDCRTEAEPPAADVARLAIASDQVFADGSRARVGKGEHGWVALRQMPPWVTGAFVSAEDARFYDHAGFDLTQIARSLEIDLREHRLARGGSTISQQLIKNAFLSQRRSFDRKLQEAILTWRLEARLDKKQILERYLNIIELGPRVFGVGAAARYWFDASPRELSVRQAAFLAALTSEPSSMSRRVRRVGGLDLESASRVDVVLYAMHRDGAIDAAQLEAAMGSALHFAPAALKQER
jgi:membrane peptidoglycan carboxypeptidase